MFFAKIRLYRPEGYTPDGRLFIVTGGLDWHQVPYLEPAECEHQESMCRECADSWECDYEVVLPSFV